MRKKYFLAVLISIYVSGIMNLSYSQNYTQNFGLTQPQDPSSLPVSKVAPQTSVRKPKTIIIPVLEKVAENEFLLNQGWEMAEADQVISASQSIFSPDFDTSEWYNATVPAGCLS